jgi:hypothetical protein
VNDKRVCAYTAVCEEDLHWLDGYLKEAERLSMPFVILFDRCPRGTVAPVAKHPLCVGGCARFDSEFDEQAKQPLLDMITRIGFEWAMAWDVDETYSSNAPDLLPTILSFKTDCVDVRWLNLWGDTGHVRVDGPFQSGHRTKFYRVRESPNGTVANHFRFMSPVVNGPTSYKGSSALKTVFHEFVCLHHGNLTKEMRAAKKERWDRIYTAAAGKQPYGFWEYMCDEEAYPPRVVTLESLGVKHG